MAEYRQYCPVARASEILADRWTWAFGDPRPEELDPVLLLWKIHQRIRRDRLPRTRTVVEFDFHGRRAMRRWLVLEPSEVSVCLKPPGFDADLVVSAMVLDLYRVWRCEVDYSAAEKSGAMTIEGSAALVREFPRWLMWSAMSHHVRAERER
jgi:hypothetical protein